VFSIHSLKGGQVSEKESYHYGESVVTEVVGWGRACIHKGIQDTGWAIKGGREKRGRV